MVVCLKCNDPIGATCISMFSLNHDFLGAKNPAYFFLAQEGGGAKIFLFKDPKADPGGSARGDEKSGGFRCGPHQ